MNTNKLRTERILLRWKAGVLAFLLFFCMAAISLPVQAFTAWSKENGVYVNNTGSPIPGAVKKGIDVSRYQGEIDWEKVKASDIDFVVIRCGVGENLTVQDDPYWEKNVEACERLGIPYGVYLYSYASTVSKAQSEAAHVLRLILGHHLSYPVYYDLEDNSYTRNLTPAGYGQIAKTFCTIIEKAGYQTGIHSYANWFQTKLTDSYFSTKEQWVAEYKSVRTYSGPVRIWQCTDSGRVDGINGNVDINFYIEPSPSKVTLKAQTTAYNKQKLIWTKAAGAAGYEVYRAASASGTYQKIKTLSASTTSLSLSVTTGRTYYYKVRAYKNVNGGKVYGAFSAVRSCKSLLAKPALQTVKRSTTKTVTLKWKKVSGASGYVIYYSNKKSSGYKKLKTVTKGSVTSAKISVKKGSTRYYKIRAYRKAGGVTSYSGYSVIKSCK